jgi:Ca2+-binding EF-hand superfamily protein
MFKTRRLITLVGMSLLVGSLSTSAFAVSKHTARTASSTDSNARQLLRMMDADRNGTVSKDEFLQYMSQTFDRRDVNKSGQLERNELSTSKRTAAAAQQLLRRVDKDANGRVSKSEFMQDMSRTFDRLDVNKSGQLEPKELRRQNTIPTWLLDFQGHTNQ